MPAGVLGKRWRRPGGQTETSRKAWETSMPMTVDCMRSAPEAGSTEPRWKPTTFLFQLVNAECVQVTIRTKESRNEADPNFRPDSGGPSVKRPRPRFGFIF